MNKIKVDSEATIRPVIESLEGLFSKLNERGSFQRNDLEARDQYLDQYIDDLEAEGSALADDFIKYELPALQKAGAV